MKDFGIIIIIWLHFISLSIIPAEANLTRDSLEMVIRQQADQPDGVLDTLKDLALMHRDQPEEVNYQALLLEKATQIDSIHIVYAALADLSRYYFNKANLDSLIFYANKVDSLVEARNDNPDAYYDVHSFISKCQLTKGYNELSIYEAYKMQKKAKESKNIYGEICSAETLGMIYSVSKRDSLAIANYQQALDMMDKIEGDLYYRIYITSSLIISQLSLKDQTDTEKYLKKYENYISRWEDGIRKKAPEHTLNTHHWMYYSLYTEYYLKTNQIKKAKEMLDKSVAYGRQLNITDVYDVAVIYCYYEQASYYQAVKMYPKAIEATNAILNEYFDVDFALKKIEILKAMGQYKEATELYKKLLQYTEEMNISTSARQVEQLRTLYNVNDMTIQNLTLKITNAKASQDQRLLILSLAILCALMIVSYVLFMLLKRFRKLKDDLVTEKQSLLESQEDIRQAMKKAENASQMKSTFIANVSHEIRTPLNAIVGFSSLVVDPGSDEEEKKEYASIINNNSDLLLNIINDILNLSKMETGNMEFKIKPCELHASCREIVASAEHRVAEGVVLRLSFPGESFMLTTDPLRLRQLLLNLLINATKFTKEGYIELSVEINNEKKEVRFAVTDTGCGIPLHLQEKIFERFEKVHEYIQGTGLGLAICKMISENLGGSIFVDPGYTGGARFIFVHPFDPPCINDLQP